jgi:predicted dehydrogenase
MAGPLDAVLIGAGQRGHHVYGPWALDHPDRLRFVAVVDPDERRLARFGDAHRIAPDRRFASADALWKQPQLGAVSIVAGPDATHEETAIGSLLAGYHTLVEKPMATTLEGAARIAAVSRDHPERLHVAHVLRYTPFFLAVHDIVSSGRLGDLVTVLHRENVAAYHMAHSFVRGNWAMAERSAPMIVAKCCHDFDILVWNTRSPVRRLASTGALNHFQPSEAPAGATVRCTDGCPVEGCPFDARTVYLNMSNRGWPVHVITDDLSRAGRLAALADGPYGRCVYHAGSNVVDHQVVVMELESGVSVTLTMHGHSDTEERTMRYDGTRATLRGRFGRTQEITIADHATGDVTTIPIPPPVGGHGGGDHGLIDAFLRSVESGNSSHTPAHDAYESHLLAFTAEEARVTGAWIELEDLR